MRRERLICWRERLICLSALFVGVSALFVNVPGCKNPRVCCQKFRDDARKIGFASL
jgi:hypothetical protein